MTAVAKRGQASLLSLVVVRRSRIRQASLSLSIISTLGLRDKSPTSPDGPGTRSSSLEQFAAPVSLPFPMPAVPGARCKIASHVVLKVRLQNFAWVSRKVCSARALGRVRVSNTCIHQAHRPASVHHILCSCAQVHRHAIWYLVSVGAIRPRGGSGALAMAKLRYFPYSIGSRMT